MTLQTKPVLRGAAQPLVVLAVGALAILGGVLFDGVFFGANITLYGCAVIGALAALRLRSGHTLDAIDWLLILASLIWSSVFSLRDSTVLIWLALLALGITAYLAYLKCALGSLSCVSIMSALRILPLAARGAVMSGPRLFCDDVNRAMHSSSEQLAVAAGALRGLLFAAPLLLVFGWLLTSADVRFETFAAQLFPWDVERAGIFAVAFVICGAIAAAVLRIGVLHQDVHSRHCRQVAPSTGVVELITVLVLLDGLFITYIAIQSTYFFGGEALLRAVTDLTYAQYARRGFFELAALSVLVVPVLLMASWLGQAHAHKVRRIIRALLGLMIAAVMVIQCSAADRMYLYTQAFGLTELRFYASAFMLWIAAVFGCLCVTALGGRGERFLVSALIAGLGVVFTLQVINPDAIIARTNIARATGLNSQGPSSLDLAYLRSLSADAVPAIDQSLAGATPARRRIWLAELVDSGSDFASYAAPDWRGFNRSRSLALSVKRQWTDSLKERVSK
ncbi:MAG: DUF4173 domain-containing protein [Gammaproteobacteria bacterium]|nr:DUF4173 domain-containing protein [Gammaproteobacteria bacterium]